MLGKKERGLEKKRKKKRKKKKKKKMRKRKRKKKKKLQRMGGLVLGKKGLVKRGMKVEEDRSVLKRGIDFSFSFFF